MEFLTSAKEEIGSSLWDQQSDVVWTVIAVGFGSLIWNQVIRHWINHWRMYRRCQKYPQIVVCSTTDSSALSESKQTMSVLQTLVAFVGFLVSCLICLPLRMVKFLLSSLMKAVRGSLETSIDGSKENYETSRPSEVSSKPTTTTMTTIDNANGLPRKAPKMTGKGAESSSCCGSSLNSGTASSKVSFVEHSNGCVKTENYYYDPLSQPGDAVHAVESQTPVKSVTTPQPGSSKKLRRMPTPKPPRSAPGSPLDSYHQQIVPQVIELTGADEKENRNGFKGKKRQVGEIKTQRRLSKKVEPHSMVDYYRENQEINVEQRLPLSQQMRKRMLDGEDLSLTVNSPHVSKRGRRVSLGSLQSRPISSNARAVLTKREREAREERILKEMNRKRAKVNASALDPPAPDNSKAQETPQTKPGFQFGGGDKASEATAMAAATPANATPKPSFSFGNNTDNAAHTPSVTPAPADSSQKASGSSFRQPPSFSATTDNTKGNDAPSAQNNGGTQPAPGFGATQPATAPINNVSSAPAGAPSATGFSFGGNAAPPPAPSAAPAPASNTGGFQFGAAAPAPVAPPAVDPAKASFSFGNAAPVPPQFGAAPVPVAPPTAGGFGSASTAQPTSSGASARRRAKSRTRRR